MEQRGEVVLPGPAPTVGDGISMAAGRWSFGNGVAAKFDSHVVRSVPFYAQTHRLIESLSDRFVGPASRVYDLGCSTGALTVRLAARHVDLDVEVVGVDREADMVARARDRCAGYESVLILEEDLLTFDPLPADLVVMHYTLQFVSPSARSGLVERIARALGDRGAFLLFEKVRAHDPRLDTVATELYHDWKRSQGYTDAEITAKAQSLEGVLEPFTCEQNRDLLQHAGFTKVVVVYRWLNWEGLLAVVE